MAMEPNLTPPPRRALRPLIEQRLGLDIEMRPQVDLLPLIDRFANGDPATYQRRLHKAPESAPIWQALIRELAIGETYFFRNQAQFRLLRHHIIPYLLQWQRDTGAKRLLIWSAGCATGEEAYSLAILLHDLLHDYDPGRITIVGTDISATSIEAARIGTYREWSFRHIDANLTRRHFVKLGNNETRVAAHIRASVIFRRANLLDFAMSGWANLILCRNVLLYFRDDAKQRAEYILSNALHPNGWLLLGHAEAIRYQRSRLQPHIYMGAIGYQREEKPPSQPPQVPTQAAMPQPDGPLALTRSLQAAAHPTTSDEANLYNHAVGAFHVEAFDQAENQLGRLLQANPGHLRGRILLAAVFANRGVRAEAQAHLNTALQLDPLAADAHYLRAMLYMESENTDRAEASLKAALYAEVGHPLAAFTLGNLYLQRQDSQRARNLLQQARAAAQARPPGQPISDFNARTASNFVTLIEKQLHKLG